MFQTAFANFSNKLYEEVNMSSMKLMAFEKINFDTFLDYFEEADKLGTRVRMKDKQRFQLFIVSNGIGDYEVQLAIQELGPGCKVTIIESGKGKGLYLYSWDTSRPYDNYAYRYKML
jgi:hypothetical protein